MPVGEQAARRSLGTIFYPARFTTRCARGKLWYLFPRSLPGRGLFGRYRCLLILSSLSRFHPGIMAPGKVLLARFKRREIAAAGRAAAGLGSYAQQKPYPSSGIVVLHGPRSKFL